MKLMKEKILEEGTVLPGGVIKVGSFLNHCIDTTLLAECGREVARLFADDGIPKILTLEASGIALAVAAGMEMGVPVVFAKKHKTSTLDGSAYAAEVRSFTYGATYDVQVGCECLKKGDRILLVDDFLANGHALRGLIAIAFQAGAEVVGAAVAIEKAFQGGGDALRAEGLRVEALASIEAITDDEVIFRS